MTSFTASPCLLALPASLSLQAAELRLTRQGEPETTFLIYNIPSLFSTVADSPTVLSLCTTGEQDFLWPLAMADEGQAVPIRAFVCRGSGRRHISSDHDGMAIDAYHVSFV